MSIKRSEIIIYIAFIPKKQNNINVIGRLSQGEARRNAITDDVFAPFLYSSIDIAKMPCEHALIKKPKIMEYKIVLFLCRDKYF